tara:strand:- start:3 stop:1679 length:1677 start_codon:yes stop_codon:yes gene_type:complete
MANEFIIRKGFKSQEDSQITGSISLSGSFKDQESSSGTAGQVLSSTVSGSKWVDAADSSAITGAGTTGKITKWTTGGEVIGNSIIEEAASAITVGGAATFSNIVRIYNYTLSSDFGTGYNISLGVSANGATDKGINFGWNTTSDFGFIGAVHNATGWKSLVLQPVNGTVGIRTTSPSTSYVLDVGGATRISGDVTLSKLTTATGLEYQVRNANGASGDHVFKSYNTAILTLNGASNLATFSNDIELSRAARTTIYASSTNQGVQLKSNGSGVLQLNADGGGNVTIAENGGNVGIGTDLPSNLLHIQDGESGSSYSDSRVKLIIESSGEGYLNFQQPANSYGGIRFNRAGTANPVGFVEYWHNLNKMVVGVSNASTDSLELWTNGTPKLTISSTGETTITATSTSGLILAQTGQSYYHNIRNQGDSLYIGADDGGQGGAGADMRFAVKGSEAMRLDSGYSVTAPNLQWTTLFDIGVKLSPGSTAIVTVYASSGSGLGMATLLVMRDGYGGTSFTELGTQPTATYLGFRLNPSNAAQLQVQPSISSGNHTIKGKLLIIKS